MPKFSDNNLLVGVETSDDAAVYKVTDELAMIQTLDFFTPIVDDPFIFGQIAATNSLSDVYAMGGEPKVALNIVGFPNCLSIDILKDIIEGGASKVKESKAVIVGGHSIQNDVPLYGLNVSGFVNIDKILKNSGAQEGDVLILTKQIGTGIINTAVKGGYASDASLNEAIKVMSTLNNIILDLNKKYDIHACTDITGFGLAGHGLEMAKGSEMSLEIYMDKINYIDGVKEYAKAGFVPGGTYNNIDFYGDDLYFEKEHELDLPLLCDPQTSGGLLISVSSKDYQSLLNDINNFNIGTKISVIGKVVKKRERYIYFI